MSWLCSGLVCPEPWVWLWFQSGWVQGVCLCGLKGSVVSAGLTSSQRHLQKACMGTSRVLTGCNSSALLWVAAEQITDSESLADQFGEVILETTYNKSPKINPFPSVVIIRLKHKFCSSVSKL